MTIEQWAAIAEIIGVVIVVITLVYLTVQLRQNTQALRSSGAQATHDTLVDYYMTLGADKRLLALFRAGAEDLNTLSADEAAQVYALWTATLYNTQNWLYQQKTNALDKGLTDSWLASVSDNFHSKGFQQYWQNRRHYFSAELQTYVDGVIAEGPPKSGYKMMGAYADAD